MVSFISSLLYFRRLPQGGVPGATWPAGCTGFRGAGVGSREGKSEAQGKGMSRYWRGHSWEAGVGGQRSFLSGRRQGETRVAADVSLPWGTGLLGLCVLYHGPEKDRAEGGARTGWMGCVGVRDSVGECSGNRQCAGGGSTRMKGHVGGRGDAQEEGAVPRKGAI